MKVKIKSYYNYNCRGDFNRPNKYDDYLEEELNAIIIKQDNQTKIEHPKGHILIEENKITQKRDDNVMTIEAGEITTCAYKTEHGIIDLIIEGIAVEKIDEKETICRATYLISGKGIKPYQVKIEIVKA